MDRLWAGGPLYDGGGAFPLGTDSVLLADFTQTAGARRGVELGCGAGALCLLLLWREPGLSMEAVELLPEAAEAARRNLEGNGLSARARVHTGDLRAHRALLAPGAFDLAVCNPPYFPAGSGAPPPDAARAAARTETGCTLDEVLAAAAWALRSGGRLCLVHRAARLADLVCGMRAAGLEPKRLRLVQHSAAHAPSLALVEGRKNGRPGLVAEPALILCKSDGAETDECRRIYHREA